MSTAMAGLGVSLGPVTPETLIEEVGCLLGVVRELELTTARQVVHQVLAMFESHYQELDRTTQRGTAPPASPMRSATSWKKTTPPLPMTWPMPP
jgi:uncharacterized membrane protein